MADPGRARLARLRAWLASVRVRTTLGAVAVVAIAFAVAGVLLVVGLRESLVNDRREVAEARADEVVALLEEADDPAAADIPDVDDQWVQVVDARSQVIVASANATGHSAIASLNPDEAAIVQTDIGDDSSYMAAAAEAQTATGSLRVIVGRGLDDVADSTDVLTQLLSVTLPLLLALVALVSYVVIGRALRPVDRLRREVDGISPRELDRRVAVPASSDELARLAGTMNTMLDRLEDAQARQRRFVSDAAHELRSPIASIRQHAEVAQTHSDQTTVEELASTVLHEDRRLQALTDDLILLARTDEASPATRREVDLDDLVFEEAARLRASTDLTVDTKGVSAGRVSGDASALKRMIANIGENAARHAGSTVRFSLAMDDERVILAIEDDGPGIPSADRTRVFERFVRLDEARARDDGGSGLGLAIVADIAESHGGSVTVDEAPSGGARLEVVLPAAG